MPAGGRSLLSQVNDVTTHARLASTPAGWFSHRILMLRVFLFCYETLLTKIGAETEIYDAKVGR